MSSRISEVILIILLLVIAGFSRIYYGSPEGPMVVWKSEFGFKDTLVNLGDFLKLPHSEMMRDHPSVVGQLEDMGILETTDDESIAKRKRRVQRRAPVPVNDVPKKPDISDTSTAAY